jgi:transcription antitermination factor NusA-like protein
MSEYQQYLQERDKIDFFTQKGFTIQRVTETLNGSFVDFVNEQSEEKETVTLHVATAEGRKYFSVMILKRQKGA